MSFRSKFVPLVATTALVLAACGDDDESGGDETVSAGDYASAICTAFGDWQTGIQERQSDLQTGLDPNATPTEGKEALQSFLTEVNADTDKLVEDVEAAGTPDADKGQEISDVLQQAADGAQTELQKAEEGVAELPTDSEDAFQKAASEFGNDVREALGGVGEGLQDIESPEIEKAFEEEEACDR